MDAPVQEKGSATGITDLPPDILHLLNNYNDRIYIFFREYIRELYTNTEVLGYYASLSKAVVAWLSYHESHGTRPHIWKDGKWKYSFIPIHCRHVEMRRDSEFYYFIREVPLGPCRSQDSEIIYSFYNRKLWKYKWKNPQKLPHQLDFHTAGDCAMVRDRLHMRRSGSLNSECTCEPVIHPEDVRPNIAAVETSFTPPSLPELDAFNWDLLEPLKERVERRYEYCDRCNDDVTCHNDDSD